jgi:hypothetical protein
LYRDGKIFTRRGNNVYNGVENTGQDIHRTERTAAIYKVNMALTPTQQNSISADSKQNKKPVHKITVNVVNLTAVT